MNKLLLVLDCDVPVPLEGLYLKPQCASPHRPLTNVVLYCLTRNLRFIEGFDCIELVGCVSIGNIEQSKRVLLELQGAVCAAQKLINVSIKGIRMVNTTTGESLDSGSRLGDVLLCSNRSSTRGFFFPNSTGVSAWLATSPIKSDKNAGVLAGKVWVESVPSPRQKHERVPNLVGSEKIWTFA